VALSGQLVDKCMAISKCHKTKNRPEAGFDILKKSQYDNKAKSNKSQSNKFNIPN
jgi:hypothetical protein